MNPAYPVHSSAQKSNWLAFPKPDSQARLRLFCFPYAGAGPLVYRPWAGELPAGIELVALHYPGRESRLREALLVSIEPLVRALCEEMLPFLDRPYALFGHSMGGLIAFEVARRLRAQRARLPEHLFISSRRAPHLPDPQPPIHALEDEAFVRAVQNRYNGIPAVIAQDPELLAVFLPILKADFSIFETYQYRPEPAFDFPITVFVGQQDPGFHAADLSAWQAHTRRQVSVLPFPGGHFYLQTEQALLLQAISKELAEYR